MKSDILIEFYIESAHVEAFKSGKEVKLSSASWVESVVIKCNIESIIMTSDTVVLKE